MSNVPAVLPGETKRAYLVRLGLATGDRGRFRPDAEAAYQAAVQAFGESAFTLTKTAQTKADRPAPRPTVATAAPRPAAPTGQYDPKEVRSWAAQNGYAVGDRGRIPGPVLAAFLKADGAVTVPAAKRPTPNDMPKRTNIRGLATANGWTHVQDICGNRSCGRSIQRCSCAQGPQSLGGFTQTLALVEPTA